ncbi:hypothetical protein [Hymenobacter terricola]|uniref:hypothetical protein n=1 Tax=Hymenobacter terricola TaxID=2819236 RepID=UPI001B30A243|nr:hypothetical protein [Hymenobacter terricola]
MPLFTRQPAEIVEATQWLPGLRIAGLSGEESGHPGGGGLLPSPPHAYLATRHGRFTVFAGDWVITEPTGEMYVCRDDLFHRHYIPLEGTAGQPLVGQGLN